MKIIIPGGSGKVGTVLARALHQEGHHVVVLSRNSSHGPGKRSSGMARAWATGLRNSKAPTP